MFEYLISCWLACQLFVFSSLAFMWIGMAIEGSAKKELNWKSFNTVLLLNVFSPVGAVIIMLGIGLAVVEGRSYAVRIVRIGDGLFLVGGFLVLLGWTGIGGATESIPPFGVVMVAAGLILHAMGGRRWISDSH